MFLFKWKWKNLPPWLRFSWDCCKFSDKNIPGKSIDDLKKILQECIQNFTIINNFSTDCMAQSWQPNNSGDPKSSDNEEPSDCGDKHRAKNLATADSGSERSRQGLVYVSNQHRSYEISNGLLECCWWDELHWLRPRRNCFMFLCSFAWYFRRANKPRHNCSGIRKRDSFMHCYGISG